MTMGKVRWTEGGGGNRKQKAWLMKLGNTIFISSSQFPTLYGLLITATFPIKAGGASYTVLYPPSLPSRNLHVPSRLDNDSHAHFQHPPTVTIAIFPFSLMPTLQPLGGGCYIIEHLFQALQGPFLYRSFQHLQWVDLPTKQVLHIC